MEPSKEGAHITEPLKGVYGTLEGRFGDKLLESSFFRGELTLVVAPSAWVDVLTFCKESSDLAFDRLDSLCGNHFPERAGTPFEVVAHLVSQPNNTRIRIKTRLAEGENLPTATGIWPAANWDERETYEMYGIEFEGHPDLRRLLTVDDLEGFPLRKDFPLEGTVGGRIRTDLKGKI